MKIFIDTANLEEIRTANDWGVIDGVTTNPSLVAREKRSFADVFREILGIIEGPVSLEVISLEYQGMVDEAVNLSEFSKNVVVKIPMTSEGLKAVKILSNRDIRTNVTLVFSANQALLAAKAGATYVSPFIGRLDDIGYDGMQLVRDIAAIYRNYGFETKIIVASVRHPLHVLEAAKAGADVATVPFTVIQKMFHHPLTDAGLEQFMKDWKKVPK